MNIVLEKKEQVLVLLMIDEWVVIWYSIVLHDEWIED